MVYQYLFDPNKQFQNVAGVNNVAGFLRVFYNGTDDRAVTYKDFNGTANPADIPIDNNGRAVVVVDISRTFRLEVYSRDGALLWSQYPLTPMGGGGGGAGDAVLTLRKKGDRESEYDTLGTFTANGPDKTIDIPKDAYMFEIGTDKCYYNDVLAAYLSGKPVFANETYEWTDDVLEYQDDYTYMAQKLYWGDAGSFYDGTAYIEFVRFDSDNSKIVIQKCVPKIEGDATSFAKWEKTEININQGDVMYAVYGVTSFNDIKEAYDAGKSIFATRNIGGITYLYELSTYNDSSVFAFTSIYSGNERLIYRSSSQWGDLPNKSFALSGELSNLANSIAKDFYLLSFPVTAGTYCTNSNKLYVSNTTVSSDTWDDAQWDETTIADVIQSLEDRIAALGG